MFRTKKNHIIIEGETVKFTLDPIKTSCEFTAMATIFDEYKRRFSDSPTDKTVFEITEDFKKHLDNLLCVEGACKQLFPTKEIDFYDLSDLFFYIKGELNKFNAEKRKEWSNSGNAQPADR